MDLTNFHWPVKATSNPLPPCTDYFDEAFLFTLDLSSSRDDRYYNLHTATFIPLYSLLMWRRHFGPLAPPGYRVVLMPASEQFNIKARTEAIFLNFFWSILGLFFICFFVCLMFRRWTGKVRRSQVTKSTD